MVIRIVGETDVKISEDLNDNNSKLILCSLHKIERVSIRLHLFFNKEKYLVLAVLMNDRQFKEVLFSDNIRRIIHQHLLAKRNDSINCNYMSKWKFIDSSIAALSMTSLEEENLTKLLIERNII